MQRVILIALLASLFTGLAPSDARACSCIAPDAGDLLSSSDYAFVGSIIAVVEPGQSGGEALYTFSVTGWAKGNLGETVTVYSADNGAACGFELPAGREAAIFVDKVDGRLLGGLCSTMDAASLEAIVHLEEPMLGTTLPPEETTPVSDGSPWSGARTAAAGGLAVVAVGAVLVLRKNGSPRRKPRA